VRDERPGRGVRRAGPGAAPRPPGSVGREEGVVMRRRVVIGFWIVAAAGLLAGEWLVIRGSAAIDGRAIRRLGDACREARR